MPLGSDAAEQTPTDNWTELARQTPVTSKTVFRVEQCILAA